MSWGYFDHEADIGVVGRGETVEQAFENAACAMFAIMADVSAQECEQRVSVSFVEEDIELALVTWLNRLLAEARPRGLALGRFALRREGNAWHGEAWGIPWSEIVERGTEVKGATLTMLRVERNGESWEARCVVDV